MVESTNTHKGILNPNRSNYPLKSLYLREFFKWELEDYMNYKICCKGRHGRGKEEHSVRVIGFTPVTVFSSVESQGFCFLSQIQLFIEPHAELTVSSNYSGGEGVPVN